MRRRHTWWVAVLVLGGTAWAQESRSDEGARPRPPATERVAEPAAEAEKPQVVFEIAWGRRDWGEITIELDRQQAPRTVANFLQYVRSGYYDDTIFHRVMPRFIIQGGGFVAKDKPKTEGLRPPIQNEGQNGLKNERGTIAMARKHGDPHSATAQFLINVKDNPGLDAAYEEGDGFGYCVFGRVVGGMNIVDRIKMLATRPNPAVPSEKSMPISPPRIKRAYIVGSEDESAEPARTRPARPVTPPDRDRDDVRRPREPQPEPEPEPEPIEEDIPEEELPPEPDEPIDPVPPDE
jgi:cyclophilin family peptidyl-prolyl cis-trans isomerase